ncbi:MAG: sulfatase [Blastopirellula sp.]|nr:MAG: sulfatase [Blastopirellula sp.]
MFIRLLITKNSLAFIFVFALLLGGLERSSIAAEKPTNFVFFLVDDLGWTDLGCFGSSFYDTPNVDRLADTAVRFTNAYAACPVCSPTRASILTGKYPQRVGVTDYINPGGANQPEKWNRKTKLLPAPYTDHLALEEITLPEVLKKAGYATFFAGKWHLGSEGYFPEDQGFDVNQGGIERGGPYGGKRYFSPYGNARLTDGPDGEHLPDRLASETVKFIKQNKDQPFFAYLSFYSVHTPLMSRADLKLKYEEKRKLLDTQEIWGTEGERKLRLVQEHAVYGGMIEAMDQAVGKVLKSLDDLKLADNTVVMFMSDNGGLSTSEGHPTSNLPLRGGKGWMYEGGIREPMMVRWPGVTKAGTTTDSYVTSTDFFPTILEMAGLPLEPKVHQDGKSFTSLLKGQPFARGPIFWHYPHYGNQGGAPTAAIRDGNWKLIQWFEDDRVELFNLAKDIGETKDLADKNVAKRDSLLTQLEAWKIEVGAKIPAVNNKWK